MPCSPPMENGLRELGCLSTDSSPLLLGIPRDAGSWPLWLRLPKLSSLLGQGSRDSTGLKWEAGGVPRVVPTAVPKAGGPRARGAEYKECLLQIPHGSVQLQNMQKYN